MHADAGWDLAPSLFRPDGRQKLRPLVAEFAKRFGGWSFAEFEAALADGPRLRSDGGLRSTLVLMLQGVETYAVQQFAELAEFADELALRSTLQDVHDLEAAPSTSNLAAPSR